VREASMEKMAQRRRKLPTATAAEAARYARKSRNLGPIPKTAGA